MKKNIPQNSAKTSDGEASISSELSQWAYLHTTLGKGYIAPLQYPPAWVISAGVPRGLIERVKGAENIFHEQHEHSIAEDRANLENLEHRLQAAKGAPTRGVGAAPGAAAAIQALNAEIKELKASLARPVFVNYRDWEADKATMLELLSKSKFHSMSFVDEYGIRSHGYTINKFLSANLIRKDLGLLTLTGDHSGDSVLIRSSSTGGANIMSVRGSDSPRFNLMSITTPQAVSKIAQRLKDVPTCRGRTLVLPGAPGKEPEISTEQIAKVIAKVFATDIPDNRITIKLSGEWPKFLASDLSDYKKLSSAVIDAHEKALCNVQTLVGFVTRGIITRRIYLEEPKIQGSDTPDRIVVLQQADLELAYTWVRALIEVATGIAHLVKRADNAAKAREARAAQSIDRTSEQLIEARYKLSDMIKADPDDFVPRTAAVRSGIPDRILDLLLDRYPEIFDLVTDVRRSRCSNVAIKSAFVLREGAVLNPVAKTPTATPGSGLPDDLLDATYARWVSLAAGNLKEHGKPIVRLECMNPAERKILPAVRDRHWQNMTMIPNNTNGMELWFRKNSSGKDMAPWSESFMDLNLFKIWQDKDEEALEERSSRDGSS